MNSGESALLTDLYQLTMLQGYFETKMEEVAVFEFFVRHLPPKRNFLIAAGLDQVIEFLQGFRFTAAEIEWLESTGKFHREFLRKLAALRFTGDVHAMPEGTIFFPNEPILRVTAPLPEAQIVETRIINLLHFQTVIASKAVRSAAPMGPKPVCWPPERVISRVLPRLRMCSRVGFSTFRPQAQWRTRLFRHAIRRKSPFCASRAPIGIMWSC
jgi:nicotinic acid phosphoribosyltransferase